MPTGHTGIWAMPGVPFRFVACDHEGSLWFGVGGGGGGGRELSSPSLAVTEVMRVITLSFPAIASPFQTTTLLIVCETERMSEEFLVPFSA